MLRNQFFDHFYTYIFGKVSFSRYVRTFFMRLSAGAVCLKKLNNVPSIFSAAFAAFLLPNKAISVSDHKQMMGFPQLV
jgi:hypothetical protein